jgi:hypothetical protein
MRCGRTAGGVGADSGLIDIDVVASAGWSGVPLSEVVTGRAAYLGELDEIRDGSAIGVWRVDLYVEIEGIPQDAQHGRDESDGAYLLLTVLQSLGQVPSHVSHPR